MTKVTAAGRALIENSEGLRLHAYLCPAGVLTIGYGHTSHAGAPMVHGGLTITKEEADAILAADLDLFERAIGRLVKVPLEPHQNDTLVSFIYNIGEPHFRASTLLRKLNSGDYAAVPSELLKWVRAGGKVSSGLVARRHAEAAMWDGMAVTLPHAGPVPKKHDAPKRAVNGPPTSPPRAPAPTPERKPFITALLTFVAVLFGATAANAADFSATPFATGAIDYGLVPVLGLIPGWAGIVITNAAKRYLDQHTAALLGANVDKALNWAISAGVKEAEAFIEREDFHFNVDGWVASTAVNYAQAHFPDLMKKAGGSIAEKVQARLAAHEDLLALKAKA